MKSPRTVAIAGLAAFAMVGALAACSAGGGSDSGKTELRVATFPPGADAAAYDAFAAQEAQFEEEQPRHRHHRRRVRVGGPDLRRAARRRQPARRLHRAVHRLARRCSRTASSWTSPTRSTSSATPTSSTRSSSTPSQDGDGTSSASRARPTRMGLHYNRDAVRGRPGSTPTARPPRGTRSARPPRPSPRRPARPASWQMTQNNTGGWQLVAASAARGGSMQEDNGDGTVHVDHRQRRHQGGARVPARPALGGQLARVATSCSTGARSTRSSPPATSACTPSGSDVYTALVRDFSLEPRRLRPDRHARRGRAAARSAAATSRS